MPYVYKHRRPPEPWRDFRHKAKHSVLLPFFATEFVFDWIAYGLSQWAFLEVLEYAGSFSILIAVIFYFAETNDRTQARHYQAWQVINTARGQSGGGGRMEALSALNDDHVPLVGVDVADAFLQGINLEKANLLRANMRRADFRDARLTGANLELASLISANLRGADLRNVNLRDAELQQADLTGVNLGGADVDGANFDQADLTDVDFSGAKNWQHKTSFTETNISGVRNAPSGFLDWAIQHGATTRPAAAAAATQATP